MPRSAACCNYALNGAPPEQWSLDGFLMRFEETRFVPG